jgi:hypothetical protein
MNIPLALALRVISQGLLTSAENGVQQLTVASGAFPQKHVGGLKLIFHPAGQILQHRLFLTQRKPQFLIDSLANLRQRNRQGQPLHSGQQPLLKNALPGIVLPFLLGVLLNLSNRV